MSTGPVPTPSTAPDSESNRPLVLGAVTLCVIGTLGVVANASMPQVASGRAPGIADLIRLNPAMITIWSGVAMAVATIIALLLFRWSVRRSWPWLILAGVILTLPSEYLTLPTPYRAFGGDSVGAWAVTALPAGAAQLVLLGALGAGVCLVRVGAFGAGAILFVASLGAQVFGASLRLQVFAASTGVDVPPPHEPPPVSALGRTLVHMVMILAAVGGALLVIALHRAYGRRPEFAESTGSGDAANRRVTIAGCAAAVVLLLAAVRSSGLETFTTVMSVAMLVVTVALAAVAGRRSLAATLAVTMVVLGITVPLRVLFRMFDEPLALWFLVAAGVVVGGIAGFTRWRWWLAVSCCAVVGLLLLLLTQARSLVAYYLPLVPLLVLLLAAATTTVAAIGVRLSERSATPAVLGPLAAGTIFGGYGVLTWAQFGDQTPGTEEILGRLDLVAVYAGLLLLAAAAMVGWAVLSRARQKWAPPTVVEA